MDFGQRRYADGDHDDSNQGMYKHLKATVHLLRTQTRHSVVRVGRTTVTDHGGGMSVKFVRDAGALPCAAIGQCECGETLG